MNKIGKYTVEKIISNKKHTKIYVCSINKGDDLYKIRSVSKSIHNYEVFLKDVECVNKLNINHIPKFFEKFEDDESIYFVYEFIKGVSLEKYLDNNGYISEEKAIDFMKQMVCILKELYKKTDGHSVHRGIKADNVIIDREGKVNIIDFHFNRICNVDAKEDKASIGPDLLGIGVTVLYALTGYNMLMHSSDKNPLNLSSKKLSGEMKVLIEKLISEDFSEYEEVEDALGSLQHENENVLKYVVLGLSAVLVVIIIVSLVTHTNIFG